MSYQALSVPADATKGLAFLLRQYLLVIMRRGMLRCQHMHYNQVLQRWLEMPPFALGNKTVKSLHVSKLLYVSTKYSILYTPLQCVYSQLLCF